ncbi:MAG: glycosyltransferase family 4 protein [Paracoccaceae bacterium]|uniref:glycosyltransferase family 4 protein n=1 Tax=Shimia thalassica TaxID=1715693 RepID=UPI003298837F
MKITFLLPFAGLTGGTKVVAIYALALQARGHEVTVVSVPLPKPKHSLAKRIKLGLGLERPPAPRAMAPWFDALGAYHKVLETYRVPDADDVPDGDAVIATWWETAEWADALPPEKGRKFYLLQGYEMFPYLPLDRVAATFQRPLHKIAVSEFVRDEIHRNHDVSDISLLPNAVDIETFQTPPRDKSTSLCVGFVYSETKVKNVGRSLAALELAKAANPDLRAIAFGTAPRMPDLPLPGWVEYHRNPAQEDLPRLYAQADVWLFTSDSEGFGLPILEAMACRTPVLATDAGAAPQILTPQNGRLLPKDPAAFAQAIADFAAMSPEEWRTMSEAARATAEGYTWNDATDRLLDILDQNS